MVDEVRVARLLRAVADDRSLLETEAAADQTRRSDPVWLRGIKYSFVTMIEACVDIAQHVLSSEGWGPPASNADAMRILADHGVLSPELAGQMRRAVGFRNVLVHEYVDVDDDVVLARLTDLGDIAAFSSAIAALLRED